MDDVLARKFRKMALERHGYKKGAVKSALEEAIRKYVSSGDVDWKPLRGTIHSKRTSVELQHSVWRSTD